LLIEPGNKAETKSSTNDVSNESESDKGKQVIDLAVNGSIDKDGIEEIGSVNKASANKVDDTPQAIAQDAIKELDAINAVTTVTSTKESLMWLVILRKITFLFAKTIKT
jgi:hypothetical protein